MATRIDLLVEAYEKVVKEPWSSALSGQERIWFLVYDPAEQRKIDLRLGDFETSAIKAGKKWKAISLKQCFPLWMANHEYKEDYFNNPEYIVDQLEAEFIPFAIEFLKNELKNIEQDEDTLIAIKRCICSFRFCPLIRNTKKLRQRFQRTPAYLFPR